MNTLFKALSASTLLLCACTADDILYTQYRVFYKNSFVTPSGSILESAGFSDTVKYVSDCEATITGLFEYTDHDEIVRYGHCWSRGTNPPVIDKDSSNCTFNNFNSKSSDNFESYINDLDYETVYSVRSFIITANGTVGYNPNITRFTTSEPHDQWYDHGTLTEKLRADGFAVSTVIDDDTVTFFGLGRNAGQCYCDVYRFDSRTGEYKQIRDFPGNSRWGVAAFILNYTDIDSKTNMQYLYVGLGCSDPQGKNNYETDFYVYDIKKGSWKEVRSNFKDHLGESFTGNPRTGSVSFSLGDLGFVGLGENASGACHKDFYVFLMERDNNNIPNPTRGYFYTMTQPFEYGELTGASTFTINDNVYIVGGKDNNGNYHNDLIHCILQEGSTNDDAPYFFRWEKKRQFPGNPRAFGTAMAVNGYGYFGTGENSKGLYSDFYRYDPTSDSWSQRADYYKKVSHSFAISGNDRCYIGAGYVGENSDDKYINNLWEYRP